MELDWRPFVVLGPIVLVIGWAAFNIITAAMRGEAYLFGKRGNNPLDLK
jgi:hypothetical protein